MYEKKKSKKYSKKFGGFKKNNYLCKVKIKMY